MSNRLKELRQRQHDLKTEAHALIDAADNEDRDLTEDEQKAFDDKKAEIDKVAGEITAEERKADRRRSLDAIQTAPPAADRRPAGATRVDDPNPETTNGFRSLAEFATSVRSACSPDAGHYVDPRLRGTDAGVQGQPTNFHQGGGSAGEGFELPVQYRDEIWQLVFDMQDLMTAVDLEPTEARQVDWTADETTPWGTAGVQANWRAEGTQMQASRLSTKGRSMSLHELYAFVLATEELLEDAPRLNNRLTVKSSQALNWKINDAIVYGTGAGMPLGYMESGALVSVAAEASQDADTINAQNVLKMYSRLLVAPGDQPFWLANRDVVPQLATITVGDQPAWMPPNGLMAAPGGMLLGYPVRFSEHAKTLGDKGDLQLVSPRGYYAARRTQGVQFASSMHLYFDYNMQAFRWTFRFGGQPHLSSPVSPAHGSASKSYFVTLDERA